MGSAELNRRLLAVPEVMEIMAFGRVKVYGLIRSGQLESVKVGKCRRVPVEEVDACMALLREDAAWAR